MDDISNHVQERITFLKWVEKKNPIVALKERPKSFIETKIALLDKLLWLVSKQPPRIA